MCFSLFLAEKKTSLGKDWHGACLKCEQCKKTVQPGSHLEVSARGQGGDGGAG